MVMAKIRKCFKEIVVVVLILTIVSIGLDIYRDRGRSYDSVPTPELVSIGNLPVNLVEMSYEKPVVVYFWATWCPACKAVSPTLDWFSERYHVVGVSTRSGNEERVEQFMNAKDYKFSNVNDESGRIAAAWGISVTPSLYLLKDGQIEMVTTGATTPIGLQVRLWLL